MKADYLVMFRKDDYYPLSEGLYEDIDISKGRTCYFYHPDNGIFEPYYIDRIERAYYKGDQYIAVFSECSEGFINETMAGLCGGKEQYLGLSPKKE